MCVLFLVRKKVNIILVCEKVSCLTENAQPCNGFKFLVWNGIRTRTLPTHAAVPAAQPGRPRVTPSTFSPSNISRTAEIDSASRKRTAFVTTASWRQTVTILSSATPKANGHHLAAIAWKCRRLLCGRTIGQSPVLPPSFLPKRHVFGQSSDQRIRFRGASAILATAGRYRQSRSRHSATSVKQKERQRYRE